MAVVGGLVLDPVLGVRATSIGISDGRIVVHRPGREPRHDGRHRRRARHRHGRLRRPRAGGDARRHRLPRAPALAAGVRRRAVRRADDARHPGLRPGLEPRHQPARGGGDDVGGLRRDPDQRGHAGAGLLCSAGAGRARARPWRGRPQDPRGRRRRAGADPLCARHRRPSRRAAGDPHRRPQRGAVAWRTRTPPSAAARCTPTTSKGWAAATRRTCWSWPDATGC